MFAPHGARFHGIKTIVRGHNGSGHIVLTVQVAGNATHGYRLRAVSGGKRSVWLRVGNRRTLLQAALQSRQASQPDPGSLSPLEGFPDHHSERRLVT